MDQNHYISNNWYFATKRVGPMSRIEEIRKRARKAVYERFFDRSSNDRATDEMIEDFLAHRSIEVIGSEKVKRGFVWILSTKKFLDIEQEGDRQFV
jgi:hypothetical protein